MCRWKSASFINKILSYWISITWYLGEEASDHESEKGGLKATHQLSVRRGPDHEDPCMRYREAAVRPTVREPLGPIRLAKVSFQGQSSCTTREGAEYAQHGWPLWYWAYDSSPEGSSHARCTSRGQPCTLEFPQAWISVSGRRACSNA